MINTSKMRSATTVAIAADLRTLERCAIKKGRANSPRRNGRTTNIMKPIADASLSCLKGTFSMPDSRLPQRRVRARWMTISTQKYRKSVLAQRAETKAVHVCWRLASLRAHHMLATLIAMPNPNLIQRFTKRRP